MLCFLMISSLAVQPADLVIPVTDLYIPPKYSKPFLSPPAAPKPHVDRMPLEPITPAPMAPGSTDGLGGAGNGGAGPPLPPSLPVAPWPPLTMPMAAPEAVDVAEETAVARKQHEAVEHAEPTQAAGHVHADVSDAQSLRKWLGGLVNEQLAMGILLAAGFLAASSKIINKVNWIALAAEVKETSSDLVAGGKQKAGELIAGIKEGWQDFDQYMQAKLTEWEKQAAEERERRAASALVVRPPNLPAAEDRSQQRQSAPRQSGKPTAVVVEKTTTHERMTMLGELPADVQAQIDEILRKNADRAKPAEPQEGWTVPPALLADLERMIAARDEKSMPLLDHENISRLLPHQFSLSMEPADEHTFVPVEPIEEPED